MSSYAMLLKDVDQKAKEKRKKSVPQDEWQELWHNCRLYVKAESGYILYPLVISKRDEGYGYSLLLHLPVGLSDLNFRKRLRAISWALNGDVEVEPLNGKLRLRVLTGSVKNKYTYSTPDVKEMCQPVPIGYSREGIILLDLADAPHLLVGGGSGAGKSNWLHTAICTLLRANVGVHIIDMKRLEFAAYRKHANCVFREADAFKLLRTVEAEMERRMDLLEAAGVVKVQDYNETAEQPLPYIVVVIDEIAELHDDRAWDILNRLVRLARALGISIVAATQRPSTKVIDGDTRALFTARLSFRVADEVNSRIILDGPQAAYLPTTKGRAIYRFGDTVREVQTMFLPAPKGVRKVLKDIPQRQQEEETESEPERTMKP